MFRQKSNLIGMSIFVHPLQKKKKKKKNESKLKRKRISLWKASE